MPTCAWVLFFGGVAEQSAAHAEMVGVASASSPWGPFARYAKNPVFSYHDANSKWCTTSAPARVDEIKPILVAGGAKALVVKSVCANGTALPVLYAPLDQSSWGPPYEPSAAARSPLFTAAQTCDRKGFEEPTLFSAPDGYLHYTGHNHGSCALKYEHFISPTHDIAAWVQAPSYSGEFTEPVPIPAAGDGVFGGSILTQWVDFACAANGAAEGKFRSVLHFRLFARIFWLLTDSILSFMQRNRVELAPNALDLLSQRQLDLDERDVRARVGAARRASTSSTCVLRSSVVITYRLFQHRVRTRLLTHEKHGAPLHLDDDSGRRPHLPVTLVRKEFAPFVTMPRPRRRFVLRLLEDPLRHRTVRGRHDRLLQSARERRRHYFSMLRLALENALQRESGFQIALQRSAFTARIEQVREIQR